MRRYVAVQESIAYLDEALRLAVEAHDPALHAYALSDRGTLHSIAGQTQRGLGEMKEGLAELEAMPPTSHADVARRPRLALRERLIEAKTAGTPRASPRRDDT